PTWEAVQLALLGGVVSERELRLTVQAAAGPERRVRLRYDDPKALTQPGRLLPGLGLSVWLPPLPPVLGKVLPDGAAAQAGLMSGDRVVAINGKPVADWSTLTKTVQANPGRRLLFTVERAGQHLTLPVVPASESGTGAPVGRIGVAQRVPPDYGANLRAENRLPPLAALQAGASRTGEMTVVTVVMLYRMVVGQASLRNLSGPISIAQYAGSWARAGVVPFLFFLAVISISLGILNILPIPLLDGGQLLYLGFEAVRGRPLSPRAEALGQRVGLSLIAVLVGFAIFSDLSRLFHP
ncbi:MAG TPA: RIP metalloprotease RseP, partial [Gammaproteobacteria bacterium]|nr:RIP metalloprotease RseP [Gammaproteobacteria bacterium]